METRKIEDVLHLYLGCECMIEERVKVILCGFQQDRHNVYKPVIRPLNYAGFEAKKVNDLELLKPILRPLSDMSEEEKLELNKIEWPDNDDKCYKYWGCIYLLSKYFDLFSLIEAGLAIDATTLK